MNRIKIWTHSSCVLKCDWVCDKRGGRQGWQLEPTDSEWDTQHVNMLHQCCNPHHLLFCLIPFPSKQNCLVQGHTFGLHLIYCLNLHGIDQRDSSYKNDFHYDTKHTWGTENSPLYCSRIISLVFQTRINVSWCCCIVLIREEGLPTLLLNHRLCRPKWGTAGEGLWLLLSCSSKVKGRRWLLRICMANVLLEKLSSKVEH